MNHLKIIIENYYFEIQSNFCKYFDFRNKELLNSSWYFKVEKNKN